MPEHTSLIAKYNIAGPRYTSYPTVPYWDDSPNVEEWIAALRQSLSESERIGRGAALYIHIPFCESLCTYCGCNTRITKKHARGVPYVQTLIREMELYYNALGRTSPISVAELHLGGGTPTWLSPDELAMMMEGLGRFITPHSPSSLRGGEADAAIQPDISGLLPASQARGRNDDAYEFSFEADPRVTSNHQLSTLHALGFKRMSLGIQDFDPKVQEIVNRVQSVEQVESLTNAARNIGYTSINYDLIYGLPLQTAESVRRTIEEIRRLRPDRIAFYGYAHIPWIKPGQRKYTEADLPDGETKRHLYELGREMLESCGYREIGMDHFALESDGLWQAVQQKTLHRNFMGYMPKDVHPMLMLGCSSIGDAWSAFAQNIKEVEAYEAAVAAGNIPIYRGHKLTKEDQILRRHVLNIMTRGQTDWSEAALYTDYLEEIATKLAEPVKDGLIELGKHSAKVTEKGRPFLRNLCMAFDARLARKEPNGQVFSKTI
jgi:oxygen-independent coproporphyrinogen-3 oxidase